MSTIREEAEPPTKNNESTLINQGSYGCIYYPALPFKLHKPNTRPYNRGRRNMSKEKEKEKESDADAKHYVSKLQKHNFHSEFEDYIGKKIQEIPSFDIFFVPVLTTHKIDLTTIKQKYVTDCEAIHKYIKRKGQSKITTDDITRKVLYLNSEKQHATARARATVTTPTTPTPTPTPTPTQTTTTHQRCFPKHFAKMNDR